MPRLIDADALSIQVMDASYWDNQDEDVIWNLVQDAPTVDAVEVVRCKECKWYRQYNEVWDCVYGNGMNFPYDNCFCSYGERRTE